MIHHVVFKVTHGCNLACDYCYAIRSTIEIASRETLHATMKSAVQLDADTVNFIWHGGEPLLAGLDFFVEAVDLQAAITARAGKRFRNAVQTNGTLMTPEFAAFFRQHDFAVGVSLDGPAAYHDRHRASPGGARSYGRALKGYQALIEAGVTPGVVCVIDPVSPPEIEMLLDWAAEIGLTSLSLNPIFRKRTAPDGAYPIFITSLQAALQRRNSKLRVRELLLAGTTVEDRERMGLLDACHPGWPCYESISGVDEQGIIYFGCDRFLDTGAVPQKAYQIGSVQNGGFRKALTSPQFARLAAVADGHKQVCASVCHLASTCDGGCVADWMLAPEARAAARPEVVFCRAASAAADARSERIIVKGEKS
jgi:radical SAM protein with 4Fe4S-binding SPASM domain